MNEELKKLNEQFSIAEKDNLKDFFEKHLAEELIFRRASGLVKNKKQFIEDLGKTTYHINNANVFRITLNEEDNTQAVVQAIVHVKITNARKEIVEGHYMNLRFFHLEDGIWKLVSWYNYEL